MAIYSKQFAKGTVTPGGTNVYTVPSDGFTYVLRDIRMGALSAGASSAVLGDASSQLLFSAFSSVQFTVFGLELRQVLLPGEVLLLSSLAGNWSYRLTGYRLSP